MTEIFEGQELSGLTAYSNDLTFRGKPVKIDEETGIGYPEFTEEDLKGMVSKPYVVFEKNPSVGTIKVFYEPIDNKDFEGLTDAEKHTKFNSLAYQQGIAEATQLADGSLHTEIGRKAQEQRKSGVSYKSNTLLKEDDSTKGINEKIGKNIFNQDSNKGATNSGTNSNTGGGNSSTKPTETKSDSSKVDEGKHSDKKDDKPSK